MDGETSNEPNGQDPSPCPLPIRSAAAKAMADVWGEGIGRWGADRDTRGACAPQIRNPKFRGTPHPDPLPVRSAAAKAMADARGEGENWNIEH